MHVDDSSRPRRDRHIADALRRARQLLDAGARREAVDLYLSVADESGRLPAPRAPSTPATDYVQVARVQRQAGHQPMAHDVLEVAGRLLPREPLLLFEIARSLADDGRTDEALAKYEQTLALDPQLLDAHWERGVLLERRGLIDEALEAWRKSGLARDAGRHSLYLAAALKSPRSTNESLLAIQQEWARAHAHRQADR